MQKFSATYENQQELFIMSSSCTFNDLHNRIKDIFELTRFKINGLTPQTSIGCGQIYDALKIRFVLAPLQHLIVSNTEEAEKMQEQEEEIDYESILALQHVEIEKKFKSAIEKKHTIFMQPKNVRTAQKKIVKAIKSCHNGDIKALESMWEAELQDVMMVLSKCAVRNGKLSVLVFLKTKSCFIEQIYFRLLKTAAKFGHLQIIVFLFQDVTNAHVKINEMQVLECAISRGHIGVAKWIVRNCESIIQSGEQPITNCLHDPCEFLYVRTITWVCDTFPKIIKANHVIRILRVTSDKIKSTRCIVELLYHSLIQWCQKDYDDFLYWSVYFNNSRCVKLLLSKREGSLCANVDQKAGNILYMAIASQSLENIQTIVQEMQYLRSPDVVWYRGLFSDDEFCGRFLLEAVQKKNSDICLYLLNTVVVNDELLSTMTHALCRAHPSSYSLRKNVSFFIDVLETRSQKECLAEITATHVNQFFVFQLPVVVTHIIIAYCLGGEGTHAAQFQTDVINFNKLVDGKYSKRAKIQAETNDEYLMTSPFLL